VKSLTHKFLESMAEAMSALDRGVDPKNLNPTISLISAFILTGTAAFSYTLKLPLLILFLSVILIQSARSPMTHWIKLQLFILLWAFIVAIPLPFITVGKPLVILSMGPLILNLSEEGLKAMLLFVARVSAAAAIFTSLTCIVGWRGVVKGIEGFKAPGEAVLLLNTSIIYIPLFLRNTLKMLSAREARIIARSRLKDIWGLMATVVGDLILRGYEHAWRLEKTIEARTFASRRTSQGSRAEVRANDIILLSISLIILALKLKFTW